MSLKEQLDTFTGTGQRIIDGAKALQAHIAKLDATITALEQKRDADQTARWPDAEFLAVSDALVDAHAEQWARDEGRAFLLSLFGEDLTGKRTTPPGPSLPWAPTEALPEGAACFFRRDAVKADYRAGITTLLATGVLGAPGLPRAQRAAHRAEQERELAEVIRVRESTPDELIALGVNIAHRPETIQRRANEARDRGKAAKAQEDAEALAQARREGRIGTPAVVSASPQAIPSPYMRRA